MASKIDRSDLRTLSDDDITKITVWMRTHCAHHKCSSCNDKRFEIEPYLAAAPMLNKSKGGVTFEKVYPLVVMLCAKCGHIDFFNAVLMGILDAGADDE